MKRRKHILRHKAVIRSERVRQLQMLKHDWALYDKIASHNTWARKRRNEIAVDIIKLEAAL